MGKLKNLNICFIPWVPTRVNLEPIVLLSTNKKRLEREILLKNILPNSIKQTAYYKTTPKRTTLHTPCTLQKVCLFFMASKMRIRLCAPRAKVSNLVCFHIGFVVPFKLTSMNPMQNYHREGMNPRLESFQIARPRF